MTQEVNSESSTTSCSAPLKHSKEPGYIYDTLKKRWVADTRDGKRICNQCKTRRDVDWFTGNKQKPTLAKNVEDILKPLKGIKLLTKRQSNYTLNLIVNVATYNSIAKCI